MAGNIQFDSDDNTGSVMGDERRPLLGGYTRQRRAQSLDAEAMRPDSEVNYFEEEGDCKETDNPAGMNPHVHFLTRSLSTATLVEDLSPGNSTMEQPFKVQARNSNRILGTFSGVFAPVAMSMFSTLLYLRAGKDLR